MRTDIIDYIKKIIYERTQQQENKFGYGVYFHIEAVAKNGELLAKQFGADEEVVIIASWLHDIASITDYNLYEMHHIHGAKMAEEILRKFNYDEEKIELVKDCIKKHRGSIKNEKLTIEEQCVADADAISHFDNVPSLLYLAYNQKGMNIEEGSNFVKNKLNRSFNKLSDQSKAYYKSKYDDIMRIFI